MTDRARRLLCALAVVGLAQTLMAGPASATDGSERQQPTAEAEPWELQLQQRLQDTRATHAQAGERLEVLEVRLRELQEQARRSATEAEEAYARVGGQAPGLVDTLSSWATGEDSGIDRAAQAAAQAAYLQDLATMVSDAVAEARTEVATTRRAMDAAERAAARMGEKEAARAAAEIAIRQSSFGPTYVASDADQDAANRAAATRWRAQLSALAAVAVAPPELRLLRRPGRLSGDLRPVRDGRGRPVAGVAQVRGKDGERLTVLPAVAVRAVSAALSSVGMPGTDRPDVPATWDCGGLAHRVWAEAHVDVPADGPGQWQGLRPVSLDQMAGGDLVYAAAGRGYVTGVAVGGRDMVAYDADSGEIRVERVEKADVLGVRRVTVPPDEPPHDLPEQMAACPSTEPAPDAAADVPGSSDAVADAVALPGGWTLPVAGGYTLSARFGTAGSLWSSGQHTGQDFAAPVGTPVVAAQAGVVTVEPTAWAGELVRVDHAEGVETWYAHMSRVDVVDGQSVAAGDTLGAVGSEGNSTGPHLHFEIRRGGAAVDPYPVLFPTGG